MARKSRIEFPETGSRLEIWVLSDGKRGHENQSLGLAEAMGKWSPLQVERIPLPEQRGWWRGRSALLNAVREMAPPHLILAAGHRTHGWLWWLGRRTGAWTVVLMKPSLPRWLFDLCLIPGHDLRPGRSDPSGVISTTGALNRVQPGKEEREDRGLILIGGPSKEHAWDGQRLLAHLKEVVEAPSGPTQWVVSGSRRTPDGFLGELRAAMPGVEVVDATETGPDWLPSMLAKVREVWVGADSVSMVYEALTGGARVGILPMPLRGKPGKLTRSLNDLQGQGWVTDWDHWKTEGELRPPPARLAEAERCAALVWERFFSKERGEG